MPRLKRYRGAHTEGFIIVAVLWILAALAALTSVYAVYVGSTAVAARSYGMRVEAHALITAAMELAAYQLAGGDDASRPTSGSGFSFELGSSRAEFEFQSEGARVDLNFAPKELISGLLAMLGAKPDEADSLADRIIAWRTPVQPGQRNPEADSYKDAGLSYPPRQAPFQNVAELRLVRDLPPELIDAMLPYVTIFNGQAGVDVNEAAPEVIRALPHVSQTMADEILSKRDPRNPQAVLPLLGIAQASAAVGARKATRVTVHTTLEGGRKVKAEVVILLAENTPELYRVLYWHDDFDGPV